MKFTVKASSRDIGDDYLEAKKFIEDAKNAMIYLQTIANSSADRKLFSEYAAQLGKMAATLQSHLNYLAANSVKSSISMSPKYKLVDTWGVPQAGSDVEYFDEWYEVEEYIEDTEGLYDRLAEGYAWIEEIDGDYSPEIEYYKNQQYLDASEEITAEVDWDNELKEDIEDEDPYPKGYFDDYYGQTAYEEYGDLVSKECAGMIISKRADEGEQPGGLIYEANRLGIEDFFDLLQCLEGMCYNGTAVEISDYQYKIL